ncbi:hypothetical protein ACX1C1_14100 [Paenibacillus sp. strain BS8-2]
MFYKRNRTKSNIKEIIIHAGLHKTGTTSIQDTLFANREFLKECGYLYPSSWPSNHSVPIYGAFVSNKAYFENIVEELSRREIKRNQKQFLKVFQKEVAEAKPSKLIISGENISLLSTKELKKFHKFLIKSIGKNVLIKILVSVRHPVPWLVSATQQRLKAGQHLQQVLDEKMKTIIPNLFETRVGNLIQVFGRDSVQVFRFEDSVKHELGPVGYFLETLGFMNEEIIQFNFVKANESISLVAADILAFINEKCPIIIQNRRNERRTREDINPILKIRGPKFDISFAYKKSFLEMAHRDIKWLTNMFGTRFTYELPSQQSNFRLVFEPETIADIKNAYEHSSPIIKELMEEYLQLNLQGNVNLIRNSESEYFDEIEPRFRS